MKSQLGCSLHRAMIFKVNCDWCISVVPFSGVIICVPRRGSFAVRDHLQSNLGIISSLSIFTVGDHLRCSTPLPLFVHPGITLSRKIGWEVCDPLPKTLTLFTTKICVLISLPYLKPDPEIITIFKTWPDPSINTLFQTCLKIGYLVQKDVKNNVTGFCW